MSKSRKRRTASERAKLVAAWRASGKSQREFADERGLSASTLAGWSRELRLRAGSLVSQESQEAMAGGMGFAELEIVQPVHGGQGGGAARAGMVEVTTPGGYVIRMTGAANAEALRVALEEVSRC